MDVPLVLMKAGHLMSIEWKRVDREGLLFSCWSGKKKKRNKRLVIHLRRVKTCILQCARQTDGRDRASTFAGWSIRTIFSVLSSSWWRRSRRVISFFFVSVRVFVTFRCIRVAAPLFISAPLPSYEVCSVLQRWHHTN